MQHLAGLPQAPLLGNSPKIKQMMVVKRVRDHYLLGWQGRTRTGWGSDNSKIHGSARQFSAPAPCRGGNHRGCWHARIVKRQAEEELARHAPNEMYCQKSPDSKRVATKAAAYESTAAKLAKRNLTRILAITFGHPERASVWTMFWLIRKKLVGSYFRLISKRRS